MALARFGESVAAEFLSRRGARILGRNVRVGRDEIDLVVTFGAERVAVEVKARGTGGDPLAAFDDAKAAKVRRAAHRLRPPAYRVDLVAVSVAPDGVSVRWVPRSG